MNRSPALTIFMVVIGIILLHPGLCALFFMAIGPTPRGYAAELYVLYAICLVISAGGIFLLYKAFHKTVSPGLLRYILLALLAFAFLFVVGFRRILF